MILLLLIAVVSIGLSAVYSGMETGVYGLQRVRLQVRAAGGDRVAARLLEIASRPEVTVATILVLNTCVNYAVAWSSEGILARVVGPGVGDVELGLLSTLYVTPILFIFGELVPKTVFLHRPAGLVARVHPIYRAGAVLVRPVTVPLIAILRALERGDDGSRPLLGRPGVTSLLTEGEVGQRLTPSQREVAKGVFELRSLVAEDRMIPWARVGKVTEDADRATVVAAATAIGRKRLILVRADDTSTDRYVHALEVALADDPSEPIARRAHAVPVVDPKTPLFEVLRTLQEKRRPLALVRRGGSEARPLGLITATEISEGLMGLSAPLRRTRRATRALRRTTASSRDPSSARETRDTTGRPSP